MNNNKRSFTLIELLVVISIIGILVSMLLPSLSKARKTSRASVCASNLKQYGIGIQMFENDNGPTPPAMMIYADGEKFMWTEQILPYFDSSNESLQAMAPFNCPENQYQKYATSYGLGKLYSSYGGNGSYGIRLNPGSTPNTPSRALGVQAGSVKSPSELYLVADSVYFRFFNHESDIHSDCSLEPSPACQGRHGTLWLSHLNKLNMLFFDKHVARLSSIVTYSETVEWKANP